MKAVLGARAPQEQVRVAVLGARALQEQVRAGSGARATSCPSPQMPCQAAISFHAVWTSFIFYLEGIGLNASLTGSA